MALAIRAASGAEALLRLQPPVPRMLMNSLRRRTSIIVTMPRGPTLPLAVRTRRWRRISIARIRPGMCTTTVNTSGRTRTRTFACNCRWTTAPRSKSDEGQLKRPVFPPVACPPSNPVAKSTRESSSHPMTWWMLLPLRTAQDQIAFEPPQDHFRDGHSCRPWKQVAGPRM